MKAKTYHPVALLNILGKKLEVILAKKLNFLAIIYTLFPKLHMKEYKEISIDHK